jgi:DNA-binding XRE family transcriptional regulator
LAISLIAYGNQPSLIAYGDRSGRPRAFVCMVRSARQARLGKAVKAVRMARGLTQEDLAGLADLHPTYISDIERGARNPTWDVIARIADAINLPVAAIADAYDRGAEPSTDETAPGVRP